MVFDGSKETCPNYSNGELDLDYFKFNSQLTKNDESYGKQGFNKTCFNICATNDDEGVPSGPTYIENQSCSPCLDGQGETNNPARGTINYLKNAGRYEMCNSQDEGAGGVKNVNNIPIWYIRQQEANLGGLTRDRINWSRASSSIKDPNTEGGKIQNYWKSTNKPLSNEEILRLIGNRTAGTLEYMLPRKYLKSQPIGGELSVDIFDFDKLRKNINKGRGSVVYCDKDVLTSWAEINPETNIVEIYNLESKYRKCWNSDTETYSNNNNNNPVFGPEHIVAEEVEDFIVDILDEARETETTDGGGVAAAQSFSSLLSNLQYDSGFEKCVNDVLNTGDLNDYDIQERISGYKSIKEFSSEDIHYLKRKLRKIVNLKGSEVTECMNLLNLGKSVCSTGIADKTLMIGSLIFQVVGNDKIDVMQANNDERYKLNKLIDELGPLIPRAVKNIIEISKEYEARVCNVPTNTTLLLERLYTDLYAKETKVTFDLTPNFDLNFNELASTPNFWFFIQKITVLVVMSVLLFMGANFLMVFLSRTQVVTQINDG